MTAGWKTQLARRPVLAGLCGLLGIGIVGAAVYEGPRLLGRRYPRTKYDDILDQLPDRESAAKLGKAALDQVEARTDVVPSFDAKVAATELREGPGNGSLARAVEADVAQGRLVPVQGWLLPISLVTAAALAAAVRQA